ncbi:MAG: hypothetical protein D6725_02265 [Planctomycetota bacterium]|nr:MAG: hypothetical protein D6725_02265 [Planctomycetota bacterium]
MRLTLRTLLAYLDDVLEAEQAKELGAKIQQTPFAQSLISRIRDVLRRRRLMAPDVSGPGGGLDPNAIAEYLDNTLSPDEVADVEKVCLESDVHLAEVAACHQILAAVLGEPVEVSRTTRERMYALVAEPPGGTKAADGTPEAAETPGEGAVGRTDDASAETPPTARPSAGRSSIQERLPEFLKNRSLAQRLLPYALIAVIAAFWFGLFWMDPTFFGRWQGEGGSEAAGQVAETGSTPSSVPEAGAAAAGAEAGQPETPVAGSREESAEPTAGESVAERVATAARPGPRGAEPKTRAADAGEGVSGGAAATGRTELPAIPVASAEPPLPPETATPRPAASGTPGGTDAASPRRLFPEEPGAATVTGAGSSEGTPMSATGTPPSKAGQPGTPKATGPVSTGARGPAAGPDRPSGVSPDRAVASVDRGHVDERPAAPAPKVASEPALAVEYTSNEGILLHFDAVRRSWFVMPRRSLIHVGEQIACPAPFEAELVVGRRQLLIRLEGGTRVELGQVSAEGGVELTVHRGRLVLTRSEAADLQAVVRGQLPLDAIPGEGSEGAAIPCRVKIGKRSFALSLDTADAVCGVEVEPPQPRGFEDRSLADRFGGGIFVVRGMVRVEVSGRRADVKSGTWIPLSAELIGEDATLPTSQLLSVPEWLGGDELRNSAIRRRYATMFEKEFDPAMAVENVLPTVVLNPPPGISQLAAECLGLVEFVPGLVKALALSEFEEAREVAVRELRIWLLQHADDASRLREALAAHFAEEDVETVYQLLWGYPPDAGRDPAVSARLVDLLEHEQIAVRYLAFYNIYLLTGRKNDYRPDAPVAQRLAGVKRWRMHLERVGALVKPE